MTSILFLTLNHKHGKSSPSLLIAGECNLDIYIIKISSVDEDSLRRLFAELTTRCVVLLGRYRCCSCNTFSTARNCDCGTECYNIFYQRKAGRKSVSIRAAKCYRRRCFTERTVADYNNEPRRASGCCTDSTRSSRHETRTWANYL